MPSPYQARPIRAVRYFGMMIVFLAALSDSRSFARDMISRHKNPYWFLLLFLLE